MKLQQLRQQPSITGVPVAQRHLRCVAGRSRLSVRADAVKDKPKVCQDGLGWTGYRSGPGPRTMSLPPPNAAAPATAAARWAVMLQATNAGLPVESARICRSSLRSRRQCRSHMSPTSLRAGRASARGSRRLGETDVLVSWLQAVIFRKPA